MPFPANPQNLTPPRLQNNPNTPERSLSNQQRIELGVIIIDIQALVALSKVRGEK